MDYNEQQQRIINARNNSNLILSSPGTGKTRTAVGKIASFIHSGMRGEEILAITFTDDAANELKERIEKELGADVAKSIKACTFHSWALQMLKEQGRIPKDTTIITERDQRAIFSDLGYEDAQSDKLIRAIGKAKDLASVSADGKVEPNFEGKSELEKFYKLYEAGKGEHRVDFSDILIKAVQELRNPELREKIAKYSYIALDEAQDANRIQLELLKALKTERTKLDAFGDVNQSIYEWRGAVPEEIMHFMEEIKADVLSVTETYRCSKEICEAASFFMKKDGDSKESMRRLMHNVNDKSCGKPSIDVCQDRHEELESIGNRIADLIKTQNRKPADIVVQARTKKEVDEIFNYLKTKKNIPVAKLKKDNPYRDQNLANFLTIARLLHMSSERQGQNMGDNKANKAALLSCAAFFGMSLPKTAELLEEEYKSKEGYPTIGSLIAIARQPSYNILSDSRAVNLHNSLSSAVQSFAKGDIKAAFESILGTYPTDVSKPLKPDVMKIIREDFAGKSYDEVFEHYGNKCKEDKVNSEENAVKVTTMHSTKGLEWPVVFVTGQSQNNLKIDKGNEEAEKRLLYVAMTRASDTLFITAASRNSITDSVNSGLNKLLATRGFKDYFDYRNYDNELVNDNANDKTYELSKKVIQSEKEHVVIPDRDSQQQSIEFGRKLYARVNSDVNDKFVEAQDEASERKNVQTQRKSDWRELDRIPIPQKGRDGR